MSQGLAQSARDVAVIGCLAVAACVGLFIWDGGSAPSETDVETAVPSTTMAGVTLPPLDTAVTTVAPGAAAAAAAATTLAPTTAAPVAGDVTQLPVPANGVEAASPAAGTRSWTVVGSTLAAVRDAYVAALTTAGWTSAPAAPATPAAEVYTITSAAGARLTVTITQTGADVVVVAAP